MEDADMSWRTSTRSSNGGGECVEVADTVGRVLVRDTKDRNGVTLNVPADAWETFIRTLIIESPEEMPSESA